MLTPADRPAFKTRVKGRDALTRSLAGLLIRCHRFARHRATSDADVRWCARLLDSLQAAHDVATGREDGR